MSAAASGGVQAQLLTFFDDAHQRIAELCLRRHVLDVAQQHHEPPGPDGKGDAVEERHAAETKQPEKVRGYALAIGLDVLRIRVLGEAVKILIVESDQPFFVQLKEQLRAGIRRETERPIRR